MPVAGEASITHFLTQMLREYCKKRDVVIGMRNVPDKLMSFNIFSPCGGTLWRAMGSFGGGALLKELLHHWGEGFIGF